MEISKARKLSNGGWGDRKCILVNRDGSESVVYMVYPEIWVCREIDRIKVKERRIGTTDFYVEIPLTSKQIEKATRYGLTYQCKAFLEDKDKNYFVMPLKFIREAE